MQKEDTISEFIGALANMAVKCKSGSLQKDDFLEILKKAKIESSQDFYKRPGKLIKKAIVYWEEKDRPSIVKNIKTTLPF